MTARDYLVRARQVQKLQRRPVKFGQGQALRLLNGCCVSFIGRQVLPGPVERLWINTLAHHAYVTHRTARHAAFMLECL